MRLGHSIGVAQQKQVTLKSLGTLLLDFDAHDLSGSVTTWPNRGDRSLLAALDGTGHAPQFSATGFNGRPCVTSNGSAQWFANAAFGSSISQPVTGFWLVIVDSTNTGGPVLCDGHDATHRHAVNTYGVGAPGLSVFYQGASVVGANGDIPLDTPTIIEVHANTATSKIVIDGVTKASGDAGSQTMTGITVFNDYAGSGAWKGKCAKVVYYAGDLSNTVAAQVRAIMRANWSL